jgi:hypothetical protein
MCGIELITLASNKRSQRGDRKIVAIVERQPSWWNSPVILSDVRGCLRASIPREDCGLDYHVHV